MLSHVPRVTYCNNTLCVGEHSNELEQYTMPILFRHVMIRQRPPFRSDQLGK